MLRSCNRPDYKRISGLKPLITLAISSHCYRTIGGSGGLGDGWRVGCVGCVAFSSSDVRHAAKGSQRFPNGTYRHRWRIAQDGSGRVQVVPACVAWWLARFVQRGSIWQRSAGLLALIERSPGCWPVAGRPGRWPEPYCVDHPPASEESSITYLPPFRSKNFARKFSENYVSVHCGRPDAPH